MIEITHNFAAGTGISEYINHQNGYGETALWITTSFESTTHPEFITCAAMLLNAGADPNIATNGTNASTTPLEMCVKKGNRVICQLLLIAGAKPALFLPDDIKAWLEDVSSKLERRGLLHFQKHVNFERLAKDPCKLADMTFSITEYYKKTISHRVYSEPTS